LGSLNKSDLKDIKFLDRPQVLTVGVLVSLALIVAIIALVGTYLDHIFYYLKSFQLTE